MIIIPDVHGRKFWRKAVKEYIGDEPILFLGDYLDPYAYEEITPADAFEVFHEIMDIKKSNPEAVTLLLGNHDLHYLNSVMEGGRLDYTRKNQIIMDITCNACFFQIAASATIGSKKYLFTHAGVKGGWLQKHKEELGNPTSADLTDRLNSLWLDIDRRPLLLEMLADVPYSRWGNSLYGSPVWNDVDDIDDTREEVPGYVQVFGHTQQASKPVIGQHFMCLDVRCAFRLSDNGHIQTIV